MLSDHYVHPEFGYLSPTRRWRRELRIAFFSGLFGIGIGAAAVIALSHNNNTDEARVSRGLNSAPVLRGEPTEAGSSYNSPQAASIEIELNKDHTGKPDGSTADAKSETRETKVTRTCEDNNSSCLNVSPPADKPRGMRMPAANNALAIGRAPLGRPDASAGTISAAPSALLPEDATASRSEQTAVDHADSNRLSHKRPNKIARSQNRPRQEVPSYREDRATYRIGGGDGPVGELSRTYTHERFGQRGFWDWSR